MDSPFENYVEVIAVTKPDEPTLDQRIVHRLVIKRRKFQALEKNYIAENVKLMYGICRSFRLVY